MFVCHISIKLGPHLVVHLQAGEHGVLEAHVHPDHVVDQRVGFVGLQWRGDGQPGGCISVEDVHQLLLLDGSWWPKQRQTSVIGTLNYTGSDDPS